MAKNRIVNTRFWIDDYIGKLDPVEKLLFLYFITSPASDICGVYEIPLKVVAADTGIDMGIVSEILKRFSRDKKIFYTKGWVGVKNFIKHQSLNPKVEAGIKNGLDKAPKELIHRLSIGYQGLSHSNTDTDTNTNSNTDTNSPQGEIVFTMKIEFKKSVMMYLARTYLAAKHIELEAGEVFDGNKIAKGLSKLYNESKQNAEETAKRIILAGEYYDQRGLDWVPETVWRNWETIKQWEKDGKPKDRKTKETLDLDKI
ncbi:MAG: hypothetical protein NVSMB66_6450 [Candidatus Doudnabacteria bacterium]